MKKLLIVLFLFTGTLQAQNIISLTLQPTDIGLGCRYDRLFNKSGLYASASKGKYYINEHFYIKDHYKLALGGTLPTENGCVSAGLSYNWYGASEGTFDPNTFNPLSVEFGGGVFVGRVSVLLRMDVIKWESSIDIGFIF